MSATNPDLGLNAAEIRSVLRVLLDAHAAGIGAMATISTTRWGVQPYAQICGENSPSLFAAFVRRLERREVVRRADITYPVRGSGWLYGVEVRWCSSFAEWAPIAAILDAPEPDPTSADQTIAAIVDGIVPQGVARGA